MCAILIKLPNADIPLLPWASPFGADERKWLSTERLCFLKAFSYLILRQVQEIVTEISILTDKKSKVHRCICPVTQVQWQSLDANPNKNMQKPCSSSLCLSVDWQMPGSSSKGLNSIFSAAFFLIHFHLEDPNEPWRPGLRSHKTSSSKFFKMPCISVTLRGRLHLI